MSAFAGIVKTAHFFIRFFRAGKYSLAGLNTWRLNEKSVTGFL